MNKFNHCHKKEHVLNTWPWKNRLFHFTSMYCRPVVRPDEGFEAAKQQLCRAPYVDKRLHTYPPSSWFLALINPHQFSWCWKDNQTQHNCFLCPCWNSSSRDLDNSSCYLSSYPLSPTPFLWYAHKNTLSFCLPHFKSHRRKMLKSTTKCDLALVSKIASLLNERQNRLGTDCINVSLLYPSRTYSALCEL